MSEKIQPGDLVMVVKPTPCCGNIHAIGTIYRAASVGYRRFRCVHCLRKHIEIGANYDAGSGHMLARLKRIPPLDGEDVVVKDEELVV